MFAIFQFILFAAVIFMILTGVLQAVVTGRISSTGATRHGTPLLFWSQIVVGMAFAGLVLFAYLRLLCVAY